jgi:hypothetical protein
MGVANLTMFGTRKSLWFGSANDEVFVIALFWTYSLSVSISERFEHYSTFHALFIWNSVRSGILACSLVVTLSSVRFGQILEGSSDDAMHSAHCQAH